MKFEHQCQYDFDRYPILFQRRWQLLNQYFCVIGNGLEWVDGELKEVYDEKSIPDYKPVLKDGKAHISEEQIIAALTAQYTEVYKRQDEKLSKEFPSFPKNLLANDEEIQRRVRQQLRQADKIQFYPLSTLSKIFTYPEDIKPDWLDAIKETVELLLIHGHGFDPRTWNDWQTEQHKLTTEKLALLAKELGIPA